LLSIWSPIHILNEPKGTSMLINVNPALLVLLIYLMFTLPENVQVYFGAHIWSQKEESWWSHDPLHDPLKNRKNMLLAGGNSCRTFVHNKRVVGLLTDLKPRLVRESLVSIR
jgi:hypothetical protein